MCLERKLSERLVAVLLEVIGERISKAHKRVELIIVLREKKLSRIYPLEMTILSQQQRLVNYSQSRQTYRQEPDIGHELLY